jgi:hypothetical protein
MNYARVVNNVAVDVCENPTECFHPDLASKFVEVPSDVKKDWVLIDGAWSAPPEPEPPVEEQEPSAEEPQP